VTAAADVIVLRAAGACVVIDVELGATPRVLHYGADLGARVDVDALRAALTRPLLPSAFDVPAHPGLVPTESAGWLGRPGLAGHHDGRQLLPRLLTASTVFDAAGDGAGALAITANDALAAVTVVSDVVLEPSGVLRMRHTVTNDGPNTLDLAALDVSIPFPPAAVEVLDLGGRWCRERAPVRGPLGIGTRLRETRRGRTGHDAPLLMTVGSTGFGFRRGEVWGMHVAWSGDQSYAAECLPEGAGAGVGLLRGGELLRPGEIRLAAGVSYATPWVLFTWSAGGLDGASARIHRYVRARSGHPRRPRPVELNTWEAVYFEHDRDHLTELARTAAGIGVERFVLDDGWFTRRRDDTAGLGDWVVDDVVWPGGLHPLFDVVRQLDMEVGLWVEPEMVNSDSDLARAHPDWLLGTAPRRPLEWRNQHVLDIARPDVAEHLFARLDALVSEYRLDFLKWDHNRDLSEAVSPDSGAAAVHGQTAATYALLDRLRAAHPALEIESCASGGGRVDLGILERTDRVWASDTVDAIERQEIQRWTTLVLPPELVASHVGPPRAHTTGRTLGLGFRCLTSLFGHAGIGWDLTHAGPAELDRLAAWIVLYKELRPLLHGGDVVRSDDEPTGMLIHGVVAADGAAALHSVARLTTAPEAAPGPIRLPGIDSSRDHVVRVRGQFFDVARHNRRSPPWWEAASGNGFGAPGAVLAHVGLQFPALMPGEGLLLHTVATSGP